MTRILVTGGSGFIGTNMVEKFLADGRQVLNVDIKPPQNPQRVNIHLAVDIRDLQALRKVFDDFQPERVVHLAARADLHGSSLAEYDSNTVGVANLIQAIASQPAVRRVVFTSTKLVCPTWYSPRSPDEYRPDTLYGVSKVEGEKIVKADTTMKCVWSIGRPTSIWGPWSMLKHIPYGRFFLMIARGRYFHPGRVDPSRTFGYVGNLIFQVEKILAAPQEQVDRQVFYLSDYEAFRTRAWADTISLKLRGHKIRTLPEPLVRLLALSGDLLKVCGWDDPPLSSFRLRNMRVDTTGIPLDNIAKLTGPLPYSLDQGVDQTIAWMREQGLIRKADQDGV